MSLPLVSIVLCSYNGEKFLAEQIDSILAQTHRPIELILSDDASTDGTREILNRYQSNPLVRIFYQEKNMGLTKNFEAAASEARGQFIAFSDQDDIWLPQKIETLLKAIGDKPLVYSDSLLVNEKGESLDRKLSDLKKMYSGEDSRGYVLYSCVWGHTMMIRRELFYQSLPIPPEIHFDIWIAFQAFLHGGILYHDEVLTHYRRHESSVSRTLPDQASAQKKNSREEAWLEKLHWIELMQKHERPAWQPFYKRLLQLYAKKKGSFYVPSLFFFMLRNRKALFMFSKKNLASQLVEIFKQGMGV